MTMSYLKAPFILALHLASMCCVAQNIATSNLQWSSDQTTNLRTDQSTNYSCSFKTQGASTVLWVQRNGQVVTAYSVTGTTGEWQDVGIAGFFTYLVSRDGKSGKVTVEKGGSGTFITLDFGEADTHGIRQKFHITSVSPIQ